MDAARLKLNLSTSTNMATPNVRPPPTYPCLVPGCMATASYYARNNVASFGHVCLMCYQDMHQTEQSHYVLDPRKAGLGCVHAPNVMYCATCGYRKS